MSAFALVSINPVGELPKSLPDIIREASTSNLGIFALMLLIIAGLAYSFFHKEGNKIKVPVFCVLLIGVVAFGIATITSANTVDYSISGSVYEAESQQHNSELVPIDQATVRVKWGKATQPTESKKDGSYTFTVEQDPKSAPKEIVLSADKEGYKHYENPVPNVFFKTPQTILLQKNEPAQITPPLSPDKALTPLGCNGPPKHSTNSGLTTQIQFRNSTNQRIQIFWIDYDSIPQFWGELQPDTFATFDTFVDHPWEARDATGQCLAVFIPKSQIPLLADIKAGAS